MRYNPVIKILTNECTQFYLDHNNITTQWLLHVSCLAGLSSRSTTG